MSRAGQLGLPRQRRRRVRGDDGDRARRVVFADDRCALAGRRFAQAGRWQAHGGRPIAGKRAAPFRRFPVGGRRIRLIAARGLRLVLVEEIGEGTGGVFQQRRIWSAAGTGLGRRQVFPAGLAESGAGAAQMALGATSPDVRSAHAADIHPR